MKIKRIIKNNLLGFVIGAIVFSSIGIVAATTLGPSDYWFETTKNSNVENVEDALDDLYTLVPDFPITCYNGTCGKLSYRYWNNSFQYTYVDGTPENDVGKFDSTHMPTTTYVTRALLEQNYGSSNFADNPYYIKSVLIDDNVVGHQACIWYNNKEFCMAPGYWIGTIGSGSEYYSDTAGEQTAIKLHRDIQNTLGVTLPNSTCSYHSAGVTCRINNLEFYDECYCYSSGYVSCGSFMIGGHCNVNGNGHANCDMSS